MKKLTGACAAEWNWKRMAIDIIVLTATPLYLIDLQIMLILIGGNHADKNISMARKEQTNQCQTYWKI